MFTTPGGKPTASQIFASSMIASGSWGAGFITIVLPVASAGPTLPAMFTSGKLYGVMHATTPTGWRFTTPPIRPPAASGVVGITDGWQRDPMSWSAPLRVALEAGDGLGHLQRGPTVRVAPVSAMISGSRSSLRLRISSRERLEQVGALLGARALPARQRVRGRPGRGLGVGGRGLGRLGDVSSVAGLTIPYAPADPATHSPPMSSGTASR